jgi:hypothetical protein
MAQVTFTITPQVLDKIQNAFADVYAQEIGETSKPEFVKKKIADYIRNVVRQHERKTKVQTLESSIAKDVTATIIIQ